MGETSRDHVLDVPVGFPTSFQEIRVLYTCAMKAVCVKLENLSREFELSTARNPIQHMKHRLKRPESIYNKMKMRGLPLEYDVMCREILDIAGIRVTCSYIKDIYAIADMLIQQNDITLLGKKDYIASPKPNGYRSFHLIVKVPIYLSKEKQMIPVEIQMRTLAMDFWACLEHQLRYKTAENVPDEIRMRLTRLAENMFDADMEMQRICQEISKVP